MTVVASETSPLNCRWITWNDRLPVCTRPPGPSHRVTESECALCEFWNADADRPTPRTYGAERHPHPRAPQPAQDAVDKQSCPRCGSFDVVLMQRDAVVQAFTCSMCHQHWLATRPWPLLHETRAHRGDT